MRILIKTSRWAIWGRRFGALALPLAAIGVLLHRAHVIETFEFEAVEMVALGLAALAVAMALAAFARLWVTGDRGWWRATVAFVFGLICLAPAALVYYEYRHRPPSPDISTDFTDPPVLLSFVEGRFTGPEERARLEAAFPNARTRSYPITAPQMFDTIANLVEQRGWEVRSSRAPLGDTDSGQLNAVATTLLGFRQELAIRVTGGAEGSTIAMRSASLSGFPDMGENGRRIEAFLRRPRQFRHRDAPRRAAAGGGGVGGRLKAAALPPPPPASPVPLPRKRGRIPTAGSAGMRSQSPPAQRGRSFRLTGQWGLVGMMRVPKRLRSRRRLPICSRYSRWAVSVSRAARWRARAERGVDGGEQLVRAVDADDQQVEDLPVAKQPMRQQRAGKGRAGLDRAAMGGQVQLLVEGDDAFERGEIGGHRAVRHRHEGGAPAHDVVAGKQHAGLGRGKAEMVGAMAGRGDDAQQKVAGLDDLAIGKLAVGHEPPVAIAGQRIALERAPGPAQPVPAAEPERRPGGLLQGAGAGRVVLVRMGQQNRLERAPGNGGEQRRAVSFVVGAGVDDGEAGRPEHETIGAGEGVGPGIGRADAADLRGQHHQLPRLGAKLGVEQRGGGGFGHCTPRGPGTRNSTVFAPTKR